MPPSTPQDRKTSTKKTASSRPRRTTTRQPQPEPEKPQPVGEKYAASTWGTIGGMEDLEVPSGQLCLVKRPGVQGLIQAGVLHKIDSLTALVQSKHINRVQPGAGGASVEGINVASLMEDPKALDDIMHTVDRVVCHVVVQPPVYMTPNDVTNRKPGVIYADMVDLIDKMFIFNYVVGGSSDLETFRSGLDVAVGGVEA